MPALAGEPSSISALPVILAPSENLGLLEQVDGIEFSKA